MTGYPDSFDCPKCGQSLPFAPRPETQHYGCIRCPVHGFLWISKPTESKRSRRRNNADLRRLIPSEKNSYCWFCLRSEAHLNGLRPSVVLQVHHIIEVQEGGTDELPNLQLLCAECHSEVHRRREAFLRYKTISGGKAQ